MTPPLTSLVIVWVDRAEAKVFGFSRDRMERSAVSTSDGGDRKFHSALARLLGESGSIVIAGPGVAKHHFQNYLNENHPMIAKRVRSCETMIEANDGQIAALAKDFLDRKATTERKDS